MSDPVQALQELAEALEAGDTPDLIDVKTALNSFRAAKLEKSIQKMVIEAREATKSGRMPDPFLIRMIAQGLDAPEGLRNSSGNMLDPVEQAALEEKPKRRGRPPGSKNKPRGIVIPVTTVAEREVLPSGVGLTKVRVIGVEGLTEVQEVGGDRFVPMAQDPGEEEAVTEEARREFYGEEEEGECLACAERPPEEGSTTCAQCRISAEIEAEESRAFRKASRCEVCGSSYSGAGPTCGSMSCDEGLEETTSSATKKYGSAGWTAALDPVVKTEMLEREVDRVVKTLPPSWAPEYVEPEAIEDDLDHVPMPASNGNGGNGGNGKHLSVVEDFAPDQNLDDPDVETPAELVGRAADLLENSLPSLDVAFLSSLYELARKLEENALPDSRQGSLLERTEREIERRIERALKSSADLPEWVIRWAERQRE